MQTPDYAALSRTYLGIWTKRLRGFVDANDATIQAIIDWESQHFNTSSAWITFHEHPSH